MGISTQHWQQTLFHVLVNSYYNRCGQGQITRVDKVQDFRRGMAISGELVQWVWGTDVRCSEGEYAYVKQIIDGEKPEIYAVGDSVQVDNEDKPSRLAKIKKFMQKADGTNAAGEKMFIAQWFVRPKDVGKSGYHANEVFISSEETEVKVSAIQDHFILDLAEGIPPERKLADNHFIVDNKWDPSTQTVTELTDADTIAIFRDKNIPQIGVRARAVVPPYLPKPRRSSPPKGTCLWNPEKAARHIPPDKLDYYLSEAEDKEVLHVGQIVRLKGFPTVWGRIRRIEDGVYTIEVPGDTVTVKRDDIYGDFREDKALHVLTEQNYDIDAALAVLLDPSFKYGHNVCPPAAQAVFLP